MAQRKLAEGVVVLDLDGILNLGDVAHEVFSAHTVERNGTKVSLGDCFAEKSREVSKTSELVEERTELGITTFAKRRN